MMRSTALIDPEQPTPGWPAAPADGAPDGPARPPFELGELLDALRRNLWLVGGSVLLVGSVAIGLHRLQPPTYSSTARVLVQTDQLGTPSFLSGIAAYRESQFAEPVTRKLETEMALMSTRSVAEQVIARYDIGPAELSSSPVAQLTRVARAFLGRWLPPARPPTAASQVEAFLQKLTIEPVRSKTAETTSNVLEVKFESTDRALAPQALTAVLDAYIAAGAEQGAKLGQSTVELLRTQVVDAQRDMQKADADLTALAVRESSRASLVAGQMAAGAAGRPADGDPAVAQMVAQTVQLQAQLDEQRGIYTDEAPSVRSARQKLDEARGRLTAHLRASATASAEFNRLSRQRSLLQDHYVELRRKLEQIDLFNELTPTAANGRVIVDRPSVPTVAEAKRSKLMLIAGPAAGLLLGLLLAGVREALNQRLRTRRDVQRALGLPLLGALPILRVRT